ncbi:MAG TPA: DUF883 domain-containing protein [Citreicella sp.]|jgi:ElaB/YqjD/DUF883 family membrane-anchored ribosome-binding protein|nr:DUF883 domain-containing protein [Salipiger manganoxidans]HBM57882.1 DUF883 domain-containing protein [Citreicella sp.]HBT02609.1 DUF883 domain-containing protein [Citreicella sp.]
MAATASKTENGSAMEKTVSKDTDAVSDQIATLRADVAALTELVGEITSRHGREARSRVDAAAHDLKDRANHAVHDARDRTEEALREAGRRAAEFEDNTRGSIQSNPFQAVGLAAAVGFLMGYLGSRR